MIKIMTKEQLSYINGLDSKKEIKNQLNEWFRILPKDYTGWTKDLSDNNERWLGYYEKGILNFGFDANGSFFNVPCSSKYLIKYLIKSECTATEEEVFEALKKEAVKRYKDKLVNPLNSDIMHGYNFKGVSLSFKKFNLDCNNILWITGSHWFCIVFDNGKWAEIIDVISKEEAEKQLGKIIV